MSFFSIIIPTYNRADTIAQTLRSVAGQRFADYEVILIDDGSIDSTRDVILPFLCDTRVRYERQANAGAGAARNAGIALCRGVYIVFLDSDDAWFPWTLETYRNVIEQNARPAIVMGSAVYWRADEPLAQVGAQIAESPQKIAVFADYLATADDRFVRAACVIAVRSEVVRSVGGFAVERINGEDYDLLYRMGEAPGFVRIISPPVVAYRQHEASSSADPRRTWEGILFQLDREARGDYPGSDARRRERRSMLLYAARNTTWMLISQRRVREAWTLFNRTLRQNAAERRARYLLAFPVLALGAMLGIYGTRRASTTGTRST